MSNVRVLLIAEHDGEKLNASTARAVSCAGRIGPVDIAVLSDGAEGVCIEAAGLQIVENVLDVRHAANASAVAAIWAPQIVALAEPYTHVLVPSTTFGKDLMPRVAALLGVPQVSDIMEVLDSYAFKRPIYAGNVIIGVKTPDGQKVTGTVRTASFKAAESGSSAEVKTVTPDVEIPSHTRYQRLEVEGAEGPDLQSAARVVAGGRGVGSEENFKVIYDFADAIGAAVGASRAAVDAGYCPNDMQVGQTGKIIAPDLYIAFGISGAIQHITGIKDAGTIVAINKDADAPIFEVADIGLVGDLFEVLPELKQALARK